MTSKLAEAISLAALAHDGQVDKNGEPYILHCLRVMLAQTDDDARIVGVLHDLFEDTDWTPAGLEALGFSDEIIEAIEILTRWDGEPYELYLDRVCANPLARRVKLADSADNMRPRTDLGKADDAANRSRYEKVVRRLKL